MNAKLTLVSVGLLLCLALPAMPTDAAKEPACAKSEGGGGAGDNRVGCDFDCDRVAFLAIAIQSTDEDAGTYGHAKCGGIATECASGTPTCIKTSAPEKTSRSDVAGECQGNSDEAWESAIAVVCGSTPGLPGDSDPIEPLCAKLPKNPVCDNVAYLRAFCISRNPTLLGLTAWELDGLFPASFARTRWDTVTAFVTQPGHQMTVVRYDAGENGQGTTCTVTTLFCPTTSGSCTRTA